MNSSHTSHRFNRAAGAAVLLLLLTGCGGATDEPSAGGDGGGPESSQAASPSPADETGAGSTKGPSNSTGGSTSGAATDSTASSASDPGMEASKPVSFSIPELDREAKIIETGLREDRTLEVPPEHEGAPASWFDGSPTPGEVGPSVLLGHVNSLADESGVFYGLEELGNGDKISVTREDGSVANFEVYKSELYPKDDFPTKAVYSPTEEPELRLITCDGFTESSNEFEDNLVIYAKFTGRG